MKVRKFDLGSVDWITGEGHAAQTLIATNIQGTIVRQDVLISEVTANPTVTTTVTDEEGVVLTGLGLSTLADGTNHHKLARSHKAVQDADFNPEPVDNTLTFSIDPSADPGGAAQTLTVQIILYVEGPDDEIN